MIARIRTNFTHVCRLALTLMLLVLLVSRAFTVAPSQIPLDFNFVNADIASVMKSLADAGHINIVVSPDVKGVISLKLNGVTVEQALQIITGMTGCSYMLSNGVYLVTKTESVKNIEPLKPKESAIIKLKVAAPEDVITALSVAYLDVQVKSMADKRLIISGDPERVKSAKTFIDELDIVPVVPVTLDRVEVMYQVKAVVPRQAKQYVEDLYRGQGLAVVFAPNHRWLDSVIAPTAPADTKAATPATGAKPDDLTSAAPTPATTLWESDTLVLRGPKTIVDQAIASLQKIDINTPQAEQRVSVKRIFATHAISYLLEQYESHGLIIVSAPMTYSSTASGDKASTGGGNSGAIGMRVTRDKDGKLNIHEPVGDFILMGGEDIVKQAEAALAKIDVGPERIERIHTLRFLNVGEAQVRLLELYAPEGLKATIAPGGNGSTPGMASDGGSVSSSSSSSSSSSGNSSSSSSTSGDTLLKVNDLVLCGPSDVVDRAEKLLDTLDVESPQIAIQVEIISIDSSETKTLGVDWPSSIGVNLKEVQSGDPLQLGRIIRDPVALNATINLLQTKNKAKIISRPSTVVQNGRQATIHVGEKVYYETLASISQNTPVYTTTEIDTGVTMQVLPQISRDGVITMGISSVVSVLNGFKKGPSNADLPQIEETNSATTVQIKDGQMLVIGGLKQNSTSVTKKSVPFLGNLPLIGSFFSSKTTTPDDKELIIIVTPRVVHPQPAPAATGSEAPVK